MTVVYPDSKYVRMYPSAYRGIVEVEESGGGKKPYVFNPESRLMTEENMGKPYICLSDYHNGSFVVDWEQASGESTMKFVIHGYYFEISNFNPESDQECWAHIELKVKGDPQSDDEDNRKYRALSLVSAENGQTEILDGVRAGEANSSFVGLQLIYQTPGESGYQAYKDNPGNYDYYLQLLDTTGNVPKSSELRFESSSIHIGQGDSLANHIKTEAVEGTSITIDGCLEQGNHVTASGRQASAQGMRTIASGNWSHAEGTTSEATNTFSHAEGGGCLASGPSSHAEGGATEAKGASSHAEGNSTVAEGHYSHTEGYKTKATTQCAHAEGSETTASGTYSHAEGVSTTASGTGSHAEGYYTVAAGDYQHVSGKYNSPDVNYAEIVGGGSSSMLNNIRTLDWSGNEYLAGDLTVEKLTLRDSRHSNSPWALSVTTDGLVFEENLSKNTSEYSSSSGDCISGLTFGTRGELTGVTRASWPKEYTVNGTSIQFNAGIYAPTSTTTSSTTDQSAAVFLAADNKARFYTAPVTRVTTNDGWMVSKRIIHGVTSQNEYTWDTNTLFAHKYDGFEYKNNEFDFYSNISANAAASKGLKRKWTWASWGFNTYEGHAMTLTVDPSISTYTALLHVVGRIEADNVIQGLSFNATSDLRLKKNVTEFVPSKSILDLPIKQFDFISDGSHHIGCIAQDLKEICPEIVHEDTNGMLSIEESKLVYLLIDEVKKLKARVEALEHGSI